MTDLSSLIIHSPAGTPSLAPDGVLALPVAVETAAWVTPVDDEMHIWINGPNSGETTQLRLLPTRQIEKLSSLPFVTAGVTACDKELVITGSDTAGQAVVLGTTTDGAVVWQFTMAGPTPTRWPVPGCTTKPVIVWQISPDKIEVADVGPNGLSLQQSVNVGGPPLDFTIGDNYIWGVWTDSSGIRGVKIGTQGIQPIHISVPFPADVAIGVCPEGPCVAWIQGSLAFLTKITSGVDLITSPPELDLADAAGGTLAIVSGREPLLWAQRGKFIEDEEPRWISALALPDSKPLMIEGFVHTVAWWGDTVVVVGSGELRFLKLARHTITHP